MSLTATCIGKRGIVVAKGSLLSALCFSVLYVQGISAECNTIDAVTAASFRITGGEACSTYADLNWTFTRKNGEMTIEWGTSTSYGAQKSIYPNPPVNIPNLTSNTTYYYHVWGFYQNRTYEYVKSSFKTPAPGTSAALKSPAARTFTLRIGNTRLMLPFEPEEAAGISVYSLTGSRIVHRTVPTGDMNGEVSILPHKFHPNPA